VPCQPDPLPPPTPPAALPCATATSFVSNDTVMVDAANSKVYVFYSKADNYATASNICKALGTNSGTVGTLVCYSSFAEQRMVELYFRRAGLLQNYWTGLRQPTLGSGSW
jgi:hypothetical protein